MKKTMLVLFAALSTLSACTCQQVNPGQVGVKIVKWGTDKGVDNHPYPVGMYTLGPSEDMDVFPVSEQTYTWTKNPNEGKGNADDESFTFQTKEGLQVNADIGVTYHIDEANAVKVYETYRMDMDQIRHTFLHNSVRDCLNLTTSGMQVESVYGEGKRKLLDDSLVCVQKQMTPAGISVDSLSVVGEFRLPQAVTEALNAKITATQKAQQIENEVKQAQAEAQKKVAAAQGEAQATLAMAQAQAQANLLISKSITPELVQYKSIEAQMRQIDKWNGQMPQFMVGGASNSGGVSLLVQPNGTK